MMDRAWLHRLITKWAKKQGHAMDVWDMDLHVMQEEVKEPEVDYGLR